MYYTHVEYAKVQPGHMDETLRKAEMELLPQCRSLPGFVAYTIAQTDEVSATALSIWQTREQAEHAPVVKEAWMKEGATSTIQSLQTAIGSLPFLALTQNLVGYTSDLPVAAGQ